MDKVQQADAGVKQTSNALFGAYDSHIEDGFIADDGDGIYHYLFDGDSLDKMPTHWMPLPEPPTD